MTKFSHLTDTELENKFSELVKTERKITYDILFYIQEIEQRSLHLAFGYPNLHEYLMHRHHYSQGAAFRRIGAMRMLRSVPEVKEKIIDGKLNLTQLSMAQSAIVKKQKEDNIKISAQEKIDLLSKIEGQSTAKTQIEIADALNIDLHERRQITYGKEESVYLNFKFTKEEFEIIKNCFNLMSHQVKDYKELILLLSKKTLKSNSKIVESKYSEIRPKFEDFLENDVLTKGKSRYIPAEVMREVYKRDQYRCQFKGPEGHICGSQARLQIHHIKPFAKGGRNTIGNLSLRCQAHNLYEAEKEGLAKRVRTAG